MKHFLNLKDLSSSQLEEIVMQAASLKIKRDTSSVLKGKYLALIFEKSSTRTRVSFEVAMNQLGGKASFLSINDLHLGRGEPLEDTAKVISSMADAVVLRTQSHDTLTLFAKHSSVPVINGLTDLSHPCQLLADLLTFQEFKGDIKGKKVTWVGDYNNVCFSYIEASQLLHFHLEIACPKAFWPSTEVVKRSGVKFTEDLSNSLEDSDLVTTDVWVSMGDKEDQNKRIKEFKPFQVSPGLMNKAKEDAIFLHCLPAIRGQEISEDMLKDPRSKVWDQAENRLHAQKSLLMFLLNN